jgi:hypothetical protein
MKMVSGSLAELEELVDPVAPVEFVCVAESGVNVDTP